jgi:hypothetical protein
MIAYLCKYGNQSARDLLQMPAPQVVSLFYAISDLIRAERDEQERAIAQSRGEG